MREPPGPEGAGVRDGKALLDGGLTDAGEPCVREKPLRVQGTAEPPLTFGNQGLELPEEGPVELPLRRVLDVAGDGEGEHPAGGEDTPDLAGRHGRIIQQMDDEPRTDQVEGTVGKAQLVNVHHPRLMHLRVLGRQPLDHPRCAVHRRHPTAAGKRGSGQGTAPGPQVEHPGPGPGSEPRHVLSGEPGEERQHLVVHRGQSVEEGGGSRRGHGRPCWQSSQGTRTPFSAPGAPGSFPDREPAEAINSAPGRDAKRLTKTARRIAQSVGNSFRREEALTNVEAAQIATG